MSAVPIQALHCPVQTQSFVIFLARRPWRRMAALAVAIALWRARCSPTAAPSSEPISKSWLCCEVFAAFAGCERRLRVLIFSFFVDRFLCRSHIQTNLCEVMSLLTRMRVESCLLTKQHTVHLVDIVSLRQVWKFPRRLRRSDRLPYPDLPWNLSATHVKAVAVAPSGTISKSCPAAYRSLCRSSSVLASQVI